MPGNVMISLAAGASWMPLSTTLGKRLFLWALLLAWLWCSLLLAWTGSWRALYLFRPHTNVVLQHRCYSAFSVLTASIPLVLLNSSTMLLGGEALPNLWNFVLLGHWQWLTIMSSVSWACIKQPALCQLLLILRLICDLRRTPVCARSSLIQPL